jgi:hypothetical protein
MTLYLVEYDVVLGHPNIYWTRTIRRTSNDSPIPDDGVEKEQMTLFYAVLFDWWQAYDHATHQGKIHVARACIDDMLSRGYRFLQRVKDSTRNGYYTEVPTTDVSVIRKVLRAIRQVVLGQLKGRAERGRVMLYSLSASVKVNLASPQTINMITK